MILNINGVEFSYRSTSVLEDVNFTLDQGKVLSILGPNGVGKTTLLKCINRVLKAKKGVILIDEEDTQKLPRNEIAKRIGYVAQGAEVSKITVFDAVLLGRRPYIVWDISKSDIQMASEMIERLGLADLALRNISEISGGELQKVQIARALVQEPKLLLLDEPTSSLDLRNQHIILRTIRDVVKEHAISAVMTMHDLNLASRYSDNLIMIRKGKIFAAGGPEIITSENVSSVYDIEVDVTYFGGNPLVIPI